MTLPPCIYRNASVKARDATDATERMPALPALVDRDENAWLLSVKCSCPDVVGAKPAFVRKSRCTGCQHAQSDGEPMQFVALAPPPECIHIGEVVETIKTCCGQPNVTVKACSVHGQCVATRKQLDALQSKQDTAAVACEGCQQFSRLL